MRAPLASATLRREHQSSQIGSIHGGYRDQVVRGCAGSLSGLRGAWAGLPALARKRSDGAGRKAPFLAERSACTVPGEGHFCSRLDKCGGSGNGRYGCVTHNAAEHCSIGLVLDRGRTGRFYTGGHCSLAFDWCVPRARVVVLGNQRDLASDRSWRPERNDHGRGDGQRTRRWRCRQRQGFVVCLVAPQKRMGLVSCHPHYRHNNGNRFPNDILDEVVFHALGVGVFLSDSPGFPAGMPPITPVVRGGRGGGGGGGLSFAIWVPYRVVDISIMEAAGMAGNGRSRLSGGAS